MAGDADWVEDVRRWYRASTQAVSSVYTPSQDGAETEPAAMGYEAAHPALQARNWPDAADSGVESLR